VEWTITTGSETYHGVIFTAGIGIGAPFGVHTQLSFSNISSTQAEVFRRILLGGPLELFISERLGN